MPRSPHAADLKTTLAGDGTRRHQVRIAMFRHVGDERLAESDQVEPHRVLLTHELGSFSRAVLLSLTSCLTA